MTAGVKTCEIKAKGNPPKALATPATQPCPPCYRVMITLLIVTFPPAVVSETMSQVVIVRRGEQIKRLSGSR